MSRRIDRLSVTPNLLHYGTSMFTTPVGFSDHQALVLQFVGLGLSGHQPNRWKFPLDALHDPVVVEWVAEELAEVEAQGHKGLSAFDASCSVLCSGASLYHSRHPSKSPECLQLHAVLRQSSADYVPLADFSVLRQRGVRPLTMRDAYVALVKVVCAHDGAERLDRQHQRIQEVLQTEENISRARKWRSKAVLRLMQQLQDKGVYSALWARSGVLLRDRAAISRELVQYWFGVMVGGDKTEAGCYVWLQRRGLPAQWRTLVPLLWKPYTEELVSAALQQMDPSSSPGDDGI